MLKERIDLSSDISLLISQLKRLAASRLGKKLQLQELVLVDPELAQIIIDIDNAVEIWGDRELKEEWRALRKRVIRKSALIGVKELSETSKLFIAGAETERVHDDED